MKAVTLIFLSLLVGACNMNDTDFKVEIHKPCIYLAKNHSEPTINLEADKWFKEARQLEKEIGKPRDYKYIAELYQKAVDKKHWKAMVNLSQMYDVGLGVEKNPKKSITLLNELISMDATAGFIDMGSLYSTGLGVTKDMKKAESYIYEASIRGNSRAQTILGERLIFKHDNREDEGKHLLECALQQESWKAANVLSSYYHHIKDDNRKSLEYVLLGIKNGDEDSITSLILDYSGGDMIVKRNKEKVDCLRDLRKELKTEPNKKLPDVESRCGISFDDLLPDRK